MLSSQSRFDLTVNEKIVEREEKMQGRREPVGAPRFGARGSCRY
jgi:hypothetical protein